MSHRHARRRQQPAAAPAPHPWQAPGYQFLRRHPDGSAVWPPGFVSQMVELVRTAVQSEAQAAVLDSIRERKASGAGWGTGTLHLNGTPKHNGPAEVTRSTPPPSPRVRLAGSWLVEPHHFVWQVLQLLRQHGGRLPMEGVAKALKRKPVHLRANLTKGIRAGVFTVAPGSGPDKRCRDIIIGPRAGLVRLHGGRAS